MRHATLLQSTLFVAIIVIISLAAMRGVLSFERPPNTEVVNGKLAKAFEAHYDDSFPAKQLSINLWAAISLVVFHEGRPGLVLGKDGWLYTAEEFGVTDHHETYFRENLALIQWIKTQFDTQKIPLLVAVVPAKARVYPEFIDGRGPSPAQMEIHGRLTAALAAMTIPTVDLLPALTEGKTQAPTFFRTDTHWTPWGAKLAAEQIAARVKSLGLAPAADKTQAFVTTTQAPQPHRGDLLSYLPVDPTFASLLPPLDEIAIPQTAPAPHADAGAGAGADVDLFGDTVNPDVILVGSSYSANPSWNFGGALKQALGADLANLSKQGVGPFPPMVAYLTGEFTQTKPRLVIWEIPERALVVKPDLKAYKLPAEATAVPQS